MAIIGKVCDKVKNADEENPERSNVTILNRDMKVSSAIVTSVF